MSHDENSENYQQLSAFGESGESGENVITRDVTHTTISE
jgi:hypothetical protein